MKKKFNLFLIFLVLILTFLSFSELKADNIILNLDYPEFGGINLEEDQDLNQMIAWGYYFIVGVSGFSAFFMLVWGGFDWISSGLNPNKMEEAKDKINSAVIGLIIILSAYLILQVINPDLTTLQLPDLQAR